jgi:hypothetical protein
MIIRKIDSIKKMKIAKEKERLNQTDYKVIKAMEELAAEKLEEMYPGEKAQREAVREEIRRLSGETT